MESPFIQYHNLTNDMQHYNIEDEVMQVNVYGKTINLIKRNGKFVKPPELKAIEGTGSATKPSHETWWLVRKPLAEKSIAAQVLATGTGALNIDASRIGAHGDNLGRMNKVGDNGWKNSSGGPSRATYDPVAASKRFPSNTLLSHTLLCQPRGEKRVHVNDKAHDRHNGARIDRTIYGDYDANVTTGYADSDGMETVAAYDCSEDCPVFLLDQQSGVRKSGGGDKHGRKASTFMTSTDWEQ